MFKVKDKATGEILPVYGMTGSYFLIYNAELDWWHYKPMIECSPVEELNIQQWRIRNET